MLTRPHSTLVWLILFEVLLLSVLSCQQPPHSDPMVTNGKDETGFPYVVRIRIDNRYSCTGSFVSNSLLLTAAHCVEEAGSVTYADQEVDSSHIHLHSEWSVEKSYKGESQSKFDVALIEFPENTYSSKVLATISNDPIQVGDSFTIVGFGNKTVTPFERFCRLPKSVNKENRCKLTRGILVDGLKHEYEDLMEYDPHLITLENGQEKLDCSISTLKAHFESQDLDFDKFQTEQCDSQLRDRPYGESGSGSKRSGTNIVTSKYDSMISFHGVLAGDGKGIDSASASGDSGGPMLVPTLLGWEIAGITQGGQIIEHEQVHRKRSFYVNITEPHITDWFKNITFDKNLDFPQFAE